MDVASQHTFSWLEIAWYSSSLLHHLTLPAISYLSWAQLTTTKTEEKEEVGDLSSGQQQEERQAQRLIELNSIRDTFVTIFNQRTHEEGLTWSTWGRRRLLWRINAQNSYERHNNWPFGLLTAKFLSFVTVKRGTASAIQMEITIQRMVPLLELT